MPIVGPRDRVGRRFDTACALENSGFLRNLFGYGGVQWMSSWATVSTYVGGPDCRARRILGMVCGWRPSSATWASPPSLEKGVLLAMSTTAREPRRPLSNVDRAILALHALVAGVVGVIAFVGANDPGWGDLQRLVVVMLISLWAAGIVAMAVLARMVNNRWGRTLILLAGPFVGIAAVFGRTMLGF